MLTVNRELTNEALEYVYTIIDSLGVRVTEEALRNVKGNEFNHVIALDWNRRTFIFGGRKGQGYRQFVGFEILKEQLRGRDLFDFFLDTYISNFNENTLNNLEKVD